jgi:hypothetical protein
MSPLHWSTGPWRHFTGILQADHSVDPRWNGRVVRSGRKRGVSARHSCGRLLSAERECLAQSVGYNCWIKRWACIESRTVWRCQPSMLKTVGCVSDVSGTQRGQLSPLSCSCMYRWEEWPWQIRRDLWGCPLR